VRQESVAFQSVTASMGGKQSQWSADSPRRQPLIDVMGKSAKSRLHCIESLKTIAIASLRLKPLIRRLGKQVFLPEGAALFLMGTLI
jgi:hypothetical protein